MDSFNGAVGYGIANHTSMPPGQSLSSDAIQLDGTNSKVAATWDLLKVQLSRFNNIVAIPITWFRDWNAAEKHSMVALMM